VARKGFLKEKCGPRAKMFEHHWLKREQSIDRRFQICASTGKLVREPASLLFTARLDDLVPAWCRISSSQREAVTRADMRQQPGKVAFKLRTSIKSFFHNLFQAIRGANVKLMQTGCARSGERNGACGFVMPSAC